MYQRSKCLTLSSASPLPDSLIIFPTSSSFSWQANVLSKGSTLSRMTSLSLKEAGFPRMIHPIPPSKSPARSRVKLERLCIIDDQDKYEILFLFFESLSVLDISKPQTLICDV